MAFATIPQIAASESLSSRIAGCVAQQIASGGYVTDQHPVNVVATRGLAWLCASEPGWDAAWESALASGNADPGSDPAVIPDSWVLVAVQKHLGVSQ